MAENLTPNEDGFPTVGDVPAELKRMGWRAFARSLRILGTCLKEAPEFGARRRSVATRTHI